jgi:hypothetical protein
MVAALSPLQELVAAAEGAAEFSMNAEFATKRGKVFRVRLTCQPAGPGSRWIRETSESLKEMWKVHRTTFPESLGDAFREVAVQFPRAVLRPGSVKLSVRKGTTSTAKLVPVAIRAWYDANGLPIPSEDEVARLRKDKATAQHPAPRVALVPRETTRSRPTDFAGFLARLKEVADASRLDKAMEMLRADRFRLFARVEGDHVIGVVKSQSNGSLVYSCRLAADGTYACCTQNLNICGGLRGSPCKHLLVLIVGLTQAGELDPSTAHEWTQTSRGRKPVLDKDLMTETFLRYKGAEAGEVDWRPTETLPEDFYAV